MEIHLGHWLPAARGSARLARSDPATALRHTAPWRASGARAGRLLDETSTRGFERDRELDRECGEVTGAILAVAGGRISRIVLCNLRHSSVVVEALRGVADEVAVDLMLLARPDGQGSDVAVCPR